MWSELRGKLGSKSTFVGAASEATARLRAGGSLEAHGTPEELDSLVRRAVVVCQTRFGDSPSARPYWLAARDLAEAYGSILPQDAAHKREWVEKTLAEVGAALTRSGEGEGEGRGREEAARPARAPGFLFEGQLSSSSGPEPVWTERMDALAVLHDAIASSNAGAADAGLAAEVLQGLDAAAAAASAGDSTGAQAEDFVRQLLARIGDELGGTGQRAPPPASKDALKDLEEKRSRVLAVDRGSSCSVCMCGLCAGETVATLECGHEFHQPCVVAWLRRRCTCPNCRAELPSDDPAWEKHKQRIRAEEDAKRERDSAMTGGELQYT